MSAALAAAAAAGLASGGAAERATTAGLASAPAAAESQEPLPTYRAYPVASSGAWLRDARRLGSERLLVVLKLNRIDKNHVRLGDTLAVPEAFGDPPGSAAAAAATAATAAANNAGTAHELAFAPFPRAVAGLDSVPKLLAVSRRVQAFGAFERGRLVRWGPTSTGKKASPTPDGLFHVNWQAKVTVSTEDSSWVLPWYGNFETRRGLSFHQYSLPGYPASHACIRLLEEDARWLYDWAEQWILARDERTLLAHGTPLLIFGEYAYGKRPPWKRLVGDPLAASVGAAEIESALAPHLATIRERARARETAREARARGGQ